jgi:hypothetical protein
METTTQSPFTDINTIRNMFDTHNSRYEDLLYSTIPDKFVTKLATIIDEMEEDTGQSYFIYIKQQDKNQKEVYPLTERNRSYEIIMTDENFHALNGKYSSIASIKEKICDLIVENALNIEAIEMVRNKYVWKCSQCNSYGCKREREVNGEIWHSTLINYTPLYSDKVKKCQTCGASPKFNSNSPHILDLWPECGIIGTTCGGSLSPINTLGTLKIIRQ